MKKIIVTGGAGFVGSSLVKRLLSHGHDVLVIDNLQTGRRENLAAVAEHPQLTFREHDVINPIVIGQVDQIYNLACPASPPHYQKDPIHTMKTSVLGAVNMLEIARKYNARILQASTSEVYGSPLEHPQKESYWGNVNPIGIRACYDEGKRAAETLFFDYHRQYGVQIKVARIFNTYGPYMDPNDGRVVSNFIMQALQGNPITMYGTGLQTRSFCYVDDLVDGLIALMDSEAVVTGPINLGNPHEFTLRELAALVQELTGTSGELQFKELPQDDPPLRRPDITQAQRVLGWSPKVQLREGLGYTIRYFDAIRQKPL